MVLRSKFQDKICHLLTGPRAEGDTPGTPNAAQAGDDCSDIMKDEWQALLAVAEAEGVAPLLYWRCQEHGCPEIPEGVCKRLAIDYYATAAQNTYLFGELRRVLTVLKDAGIPVIVLKGADLANTLYADAGLRPMSDLDLLVPYGSYSSSLQLLEQKLGYQREQVDTSPDFQRVVAYHKHLLGGANQQVKVEMHWNLVVSEVSWYAVPVSWFWEHTQACTVLDGAETGPVKRLRNEANLLYLCAHAMLQHGVNQSLLIWIYDIHALVTRYQDVIDWDWLVEETRQLGWAGVLAAGLRESQACFGTKIPQTVLEVLEESAERRLARLVEFKAKFPEMRLLYDWYTLLSLRWIDRLRYAAVLVFPNHAYMIRRYHPRPVWIWPVYYLYRWWRMVGDAVHALRNGLWRYNPLP